MIYVALKAYLWYISDTIYSFFYWTKTEQDSAISLLLLLSWSDHWWACHCAECIFQHFWWTTVFMQPLVAIFNSRFYWRTFSNVCMALTTLLYVFLMLEQLLTKAHSTISDNFCLYYSSRGMQSANFLHNINFCCKTGVEVNWWRSNARDYWLLRYKQCGWDGYKWELLLNKEGSHGEGHCGRWT